MTQEAKAPIWYLPGPYYRYAEDVKALARKAGVRIVDANVTEDRRGAADPEILPEVTIKPEYIEQGLAAIEAKGRELEAQYRALREQEDAAERAASRRMTKAEREAVETARKLTAPASE